MRDGGGWAGWEQDTGADEDGEQPAAEPDAPAPAAGMGALCSQAPTTDCRMATSSGAIAASA